ncbi:MAG: selenide, water dikinase SelD [Deltaproteobacteria bacterium]|nr:selenide, water dikinase SelD [Deltaproteobacteria bacterium]
MTNEVRLTSLVQGGGCARKVPAETLLEALRGLPVITHPWADPRPGPMDDAAVLAPDGYGRSLVATIDIITPIVDDARTWGAIAGTNAISDVYAMGGEPQFALAFVGLPLEVAGNETMHAVMAGLHDACARARCAIVGGHSMLDAEPKCGLAVIGTVAPERVWAQGGARAGDVLVLTKALGTGIVSQAIKKGLASEALAAAAIAQMTRLNDVACAVGHEVSAHAATDVTGYGLLGHLRHVAEASKLRAVVRASAVPLLDGVVGLARQDVVPGGSRRNLKYAERVTRFADEVEDVMRLVLADAQTSGGLLLAVPPDRADEAVRSLRARGDLPAGVIGELRETTEPGIDVEA